MSEQLTITVSKKDLDTFVFLTITIARIQQEIGSENPPHHAYHATLHSLRELRSAWALKVMDGGLQI